jgi:hypothetical protein
MVEWLGRYAQVRGIGPICPGRGGGVHGDDLDVYVGLYVYIYK